MFARLSTYQGSPVPATGDLAANAVTVVSQVKHLPGFLGVYYLVDRASGKARTLTLWANEDAMRESEEVTSHIREEVAAREGQRVLSVERFEVGFSHLKP
ncbi:hypothetical protein [Streptomyces sp. NBC_01216]|uniref:hypothetical protein n=1 Tax=unclassified Streptomyces TaxID=2593676 RepID=UPI002E163879|nr:hypothetical protein OG393_16300 [Streptomyces sp. NBC_01216]